LGGAMLVKVAAMIELTINDFNFNMFDSDRLVSIPVQSSAPGADDRLVQFVA
jgi:hypothetical protein